MLFVGSRLIWLTGRYRRSDNMGVSSHVIGARVLGQFGCTGGDDGPVGMRFVPAVASVREFQINSDSGYRLGTCNADEVHTGFDLCEPTGAVVVAFN